MITLQPINFKDIYHIKELLRICTIIIFFNEKKISFSRKYILGEGGLPARFELTIYSHTLNHRTNRPRNLCFKKKSAGILFILKYTVYLKQPVRVPFTMYFISTLVVKYMYINETQTNDFNQIVKYINENNRMCIDKYILQRPDFKFLLLQVRTCGVLFDLTYVVIQQAGALCTHLSWTVYLQTVEKQKDLWTLTVTRIQQKP